MQIKVDIKGHRLSLDANDRHYLRAYISDDQYPTDIRLECEGDHVWTAEIGSLLIEADSPATIFELLFQTLTEV